MNVSISVPSGPLEQEWVAEAEYFFPEIGPILGSKDIPPPVIVSVSVRVNSSRAILSPTIAEPILRNPAQFRFAKAEPLCGKPILADQRAAEHGWIVGIQHDRHSGVEQLPYRVVFDASYNTSDQIAGDANLQRNVFFAQAPHERLIRRRGDPVADAFGA
jgi:hypothetical protein